MTKNLRITIKTTLSITQYHNQTSKPKNNKKTVLKSRMWTKKFRSLRENFFTHQFIALSKTAVWTKTTLFSLHSSILFSTKTTPNFFTRFISRFKNHSNKIDLKKDFSNTPLRVVKKTAPQYNSNSLNCKKIRAQ